MGRTFGVVALLLIIGVAAGADELDLDGGVFIAHLVPDIAQTDQPVEGWGDYYLNSGFAIDSSASQVNRIDSQDWSLWFILAAWDEAKRYSAVQFALGDYEASIYDFYQYDPSAPGSFLELPGPGWPGPGAMTVVTATGGDCWDGNYLPVYWFSGYAYSQGVIPLGPDPDTGISFTSCETVPEEVPAECFGGMGIFTNGIECHPETPPPPEDQVCCVGTTCLILTEAECTAQDGEWRLGLDSCTPNPCAAVAACCAYERCYLVTFVECEEFDGHWHRGYPSCEVDCDEPLRVCCVVNDCYLSWEEDCHFAEGDWRPEDTSCDPNPCDTGVERTTWGGIKAKYR